MKHSSTVRWTETVFRAEVWTLTEAAKASSLHCHIQTVPWVHPLSCPKSAGRPFPESKAAGKWSVDSSPIGVKLKTRGTLALFHLCDHSKCFCTVHSLCQFWFLLSTFKTLLFYIMNLVRIWIFTTNYHRSYRKFGYCTLYEQLKNRGSIPGSRRRFFSSPKWPDQL